MEGISYGHIFFLFVFIFFSLILRFSASRGYFLLLGHQVGLGTAKSNGNSPPHTQHRCKLGSFEELTCWNTFFVWGNVIVIERWLVRWLDGWLLRGFAGGAKTVCQHPRKGGVEATIFTQIFIG